MDLQCTHAVHCDALCFDNVQDALAVIFVYDSKQSYVRVKRAAQNVALHLNRIDTPRLKVKYLACSMRNYNERRSLKLHRMHISNRQRQP